MSLNFKAGLKRLLTFDKKLQSLETLESGLYHYVRETEQEKSRIHLRIDPDGHGTLIVNASSVMHLNPTAAFMAWLILEGKTKEERIHALTARYSVSKKQAQNDLSSILFHHYRKPPAKRAKLQTTPYTRHPLTNSRTLLY